MLIEPKPFCPPPKKDKGFSLFRQITTLTHKTIGNHNLEIAKNSLYFSANKVILMKTLRTLFPFTKWGGENLFVYGLLRAPSAGFWSDLSGRAESVEGNEN